MTEPKFQKKSYLAQILANWVQICPNLRFLVNYLSLNHQIYLILHILTGKQDILTDDRDPVAEKKIRVKFRPNLELSPNYFCLQIHFLDFY